MSQDDPNASATPAPTAAHKKEDTADLLVRIASTGPIWVRALALLVLLATTITPYWQKVSEWMDDYQMNKILQTTISVSTPGTQNPYPVTNGEPVAAPPDAPRLAANTLSPEDSEELTRHIAVLQEQPNFKRLLVNQKKATVAYSIFPSDGCILINHTNRTVKLDLVRADELPKKPLAQSASQGQKAKPSVAKPQSTGHFHLIPAALSSDDVDWNRPQLRTKINSVLQNDSSFDNSQKTPMQGSCLNPHPGQFRFWSQPVAPCMEQVWRQFADGCTHYQFHNFCNNMWDPAIHWTYCALH